MANRSLNLRLMTRKRLPNGYQDEIVHDIDLGHSPFVTNPGEVTLDGIKYKFDRFTTFGDLVYVDNPDNVPESWLKEQG